MKMLSPENKSRTFPCPLFAPDVDVELAPVPGDVVEGTDEEEVVVDPLFS